MTAANSERRRPSRKADTILRRSWRRWSTYRIPVPPPISRPKAYALALLIPAATGCIQHALVPLVALAPFILFFLAVFLVSWLGGRGPGLVACVVSAAFANYLFLPPVGWSVGHREAILVGLFLAISTIITVLSASVAEAVQDARLAADLLRQSEAICRSRSRQLEAVLNATHAQLALLDAHMDFLMVNDAYEKGCGHARAELIGRNHFELFPNEDNERIFQRVVETGEPFAAAEKPFEYATQPHRGTTYWNWTLAPIKSTEGRIEGVLLSLLDVTDQVLGRKKLQAITERLMRLQELAAALSVSETQEQVAEVVFEHGQRFTGCCAVAVFSSDGSSLKLDYAKGVHVDRGLSNAPVVPIGAAYPPAECLRTRAAVWVETAEQSDTRYPAMADTRSRLGMAASANLPLIVRGEVIGVLGFGFEGPHEFTPGDRSYFRAVADQCGLALSRASSYEVLQTEARRKDEFLAMLSHELRNPLAPIRNSLYVVRRSGPGGEQARRALAVIERQTEHLIRLVDDLLDHVRIARGTVQLARERRNLNEILEHVVEDYRPVFDSKSVCLELGLPEHPVWAEVDSARLTQAIGNLLHNSWKFTDPGGCVAVLLENREPDLAAIVVRDTGRGLSPELVGRLFEPFAQGQLGLARSEGGLGLGLNLSRSLVALHGGTLTGKSEGPGRGSEFVATIPLTCAPPNHPGPVKPPAAKS
jgi:PAS domain S-box-containing protein